jgi:hypothetical protein
MRVRPVEKEAREGDRAVHIGMKRKEEEGDEGWQEEKILIAALACQDAAITPQGGA